MLLRKKILEDLKIAMKSGDQKARDTLRSLDSMIKNEEIAQKKREVGLDDAGMVTLVKRAIKQRKDSATQFRNGGREDLAENEEIEIRVIEKYLPVQMSEEEVTVIVKRIVEETGATTKSDMGKVMGKVMNEVGDGSDGNTVRAVVESFLE